MSDADILRLDTMPGLLSDLGFAAADATDAIAAAGRALAEPKLVAAVGGYAAQITGQLGEYLKPGSRHYLFDNATAEPASVLGVGVVPLLAMVATVEQVKAFHAGRGIPREISQATLADLGRQVATHRRVYGKFGLETHGWMTLHWTGALYQLGRLQFDLGRLDAASGSSPSLPDGVALGDWVPGVHIPEAGPLDPESAISSLQQLRPFLEAHFPEVRASVLRCTSWLLDPYLGDQLPDSNVARFQRLFTLDGWSEPSNDDVLYFVFRKRVIDVDQLPRDTRLQRVVLERIKAGGQWRNRRGWRPF